MGQVVQTRTSLQDLDRIWDHLAEQSPARASQWVKMVKEKLELLAAYPMMGRARDELAPGMRSFPVGHYLILYIPQANGILVMRIIHTRQDLTGPFE